MHLGIWIFLIASIGGGIYAGLQDRFGPNIIAGYRAYKEECRQWAELNAQHLDDKFPGSGRQ